MNVTVRSLTPTSVEVSWVGSNLPELVRWVVYYSPSANTSSAAERAVNVSSADTSVMINRLQEGLEYTFEVVAVTLVEGEVVFGQRIMATTVKANSMWKFVFYVASY